METLIEKLEQERDSVNKLFKKTGDARMRLGIGALNKAIKIAKHHSDWVSVDEQLPDDRGYFLVRVNTGEITVDYYDYDNGYWSKNYGNVTHFMRLPQPPSEV